VPDPGRSDPEVIDFSPRPAAGHANPALARVITQITYVPVRTSDAAGDGGGQVFAKPAPVTGPPLAARGKPEVTAAICQLTGDQPATACTPAVRSLLPGD
jgi:hypothetical protein